MPIVTHLTPEKYEEMISMAAIAARFGSILRCVSATNMKGGGDIDTRFLIGTDDVEIVDYYSGVLILEGKVSGDESILICCFDARVEDYAVSKALH